MGSTSMTLDRHITPRQQIEADLAWNGRVIVASNVARGYGEWAHVHYAAIKETRGEDAGRVWAAITLFSGSTTLTYKDMTETSGCIAEGASRKVLDALTPTTNETALAWRKEARDALAKQQGKVKAEPGDVILFARPIEFTDGTKHDTFMLEVQRTTRTRTGQTRRTFTLRKVYPEHGMAEGARASVPRWQDREHVVVRAAELAGQDAAA